MDRGVNGHARLDAFSSDEEPLQVYERRIEYEVADRVGQDFLSDSDFDGEEDARVTAEIENRRAAAVARPRVVRRVRARRARARAVVRRGRRGGGNVAVVRRDLAPRLPMTRARWDRLIAYGSRAGWTDPDAMLEIRGMIGYGLPSTGYVGIPGPVLTTTVPDGVALVLSQGDDSMRFENCVLFFVYVEMLGVGILMVVSWSFTGDTSVLVLPAQEVRMVYDPPVNGLFYGLE